MKRLRVTVDGKVFDVTVEVVGEEQSQATAGSPVMSVPVAAPPAPPKRAAQSQGSGNVTSPLAGRIVQVHPQVGQQVAEGDLVITLEAMKMNTQVFASRTGKVATINVQAGQAVQEGDVLMTLE
jgi:glutaconyl-CoA/methylmalonyl-CoA decarboxylase subunit gamma